MAINRRQFLGRTGLVAAGTVLGPNLFFNPLVRQAMASTIGDKWLIVLFLDGGNDGLNTVVPVSDGSYSHRTTYDLVRKTGGNGINLSVPSLAATLIGTDPGTGAQLALHPGFAGLKNLYDRGWLAVVQGCGYPDYTLSHDEARTIWRTANPLGVSGLAGTGWLGRHLASASGGYSPTDVPAVSIDSEVGPEFRQSATSVLAIDSLADFSFPYDDFDGDDVPAKRTALTRLFATWAAADPQAAKRYLGSSGAATLAASESYQQLHDFYLSARQSWSDQYDALDSGPANDLREMAKIIYGETQNVVGVASRFFQFSNGGYDTHSDQGTANPGDQQYDLHKDVGDALKLFYDDLQDMGVADKVVTVVWSEFSRRIEQNDSGTDHGSQGPMFVVGGGVAGGVYGNHPDIASTDDDGNTVYSQAAGQFRSTDFRDVYGTILKRWVGMAQPAILSDVLAVDAGDPDLYWTVPNFDLGFLP
jgi:uncharacterized protein (DUF1501 family)